MILKVAWQTLLLVMIYYALLLGGVLLRFQAWPDYVEVYPWVGNIRGILAGTPSWRDALSIALDEPLLEIGRTLPDYAISEWNLTIVPDKLAIVAAIAALLAVHRHLARRSCRIDAAVLSGAGSATAALASATVGWTVCCGAPSWVVIFAMLGLWAPTAMAIEPYGGPITLAGLFLLAGGVLVQACFNRAKERS
jgi:hypothetical protein